MNLDLWIELECLRYRNRSQGGCQIITKNLTKEMEVETGIGTSLNEDEVQNYISEVIDELQEHKKLK